MIKACWIIAVLIAVSGCTPHNQNTMDISNYRRLHENVVPKDKGEDFITYEYKNIRVDEVASLAATYCREHGDKQAHLREIILYRNFSRRATFDCTNLAIKE